MSKKIEINKKIKNTLTILHIITQYIDIISDYLLIQQLIHLNK